MGLDITAYRGLKRDENPKLDADGYPDGPDRFLAYASSVDFSEENWPGRAQGIERGAVYEFAASDGFRAGSYSGYNRWRDNLAKLAGFKGGADEAWATPEPYAFGELINFADNEGVIGPVVSAKLAKDFADYEERATAFAPTIGEEGGYWLIQYGRWKAAFEMAADGGAVLFY